ncbi:LptF/LptG family permease [Gimesia panareensis]|uniref:Putative permease YjgP/YjgQ family protein n=1 Tax=Gimesia panareensis TaxID=2527978 RepID=A0A517Q7E5_9PLAN|nr:LptF/LptG family permease [Gimesia panareensis]QDT27528.1 putative permease YjgP/YjgQ family protein [Gimesia panareensis]QDU49641.1 putative permease YjgP/YjgQ family protein [Gimesia panareensis]
MRLLQRYILFELLRVFTLMITVLTVLLVFVGAFQQASKQGLGATLVLKILPFIVPSMLPFTIPATLLLTVCVVYGRISGDQEITAAKAAGINVLSLLWPSFILGGFLSLGSLLLSDQIIPWAEKNIETTIATELETIFLEKLRSQNQIHDPNSGISITVMGVRDKTLLVPTFRYSPPGKKPVHLQAEEATLEFDLPHQQVILHLSKGHIDFPGKPRFYVEKDIFPFPLPSQTPTPKARHMSVRSIKAELVELQAKKNDFEFQRDIEVAMLLALGDFEHFKSPEVNSNLPQNHFQEDRQNKLRTALSSRFALSCSCFFFVLVGCPFSIAQARRQFLTSFFLVFMPILLFYYPIVLLMLNLSKLGKIEPSWSLWIGNAGLLLIAIHMLRKVLRN